MKILLIETSTSVCSVALADGDRIVNQRQTDDPNAHSTRLPLFVSQLMPASGLDAVCVSSGPGSYTGLRIGVSTAKGICYALGIPLLAVPTLQAMASHYFSLHPDYRGLVCPMIDARRMECYTLIASRDAVIRPTQADVIVSGIYDQYLDSGLLTFIGNGAFKTQPILGQHPNARFEPFTVSAPALLPLAQRMLAQGETADVAYFEPFYLKDFVAKKSVVHGLRVTV